MSRRKRRSAFDQVSEFDRGRIVACREIVDYLSEKSEGTTDRRCRSYPPQCTTSREDRQMVRMAVTERSVTSRTVAQHIESVTHHSVSAAFLSTPFIAEWSVRKTSIAWSTLDAEPQTSPPPMVR
ncbi:uncharacterized protein TNCV_4519361 [Trichonephila clavipes]|nr:uncharacterized protein TNCV_4519361 [Trichonephila clavipes]